MKKLLTIFLGLVLLLPICEPAFADASEDERAYIYDEEYNAVPSASSYQVKKVLDVTNLGVGLKEAQDLFVDNEDQLYILDSGNGRVLWVDENLELVKVIDTFTYNGEPLTLSKGAQGIFFREATDQLYIADTQANRIVVCDRDGMVDRIYEKPVSNLLGENIAYAPRKVIVDNLGVMYVLSQNVNTGALKIDSENELLGYYGVNTIKQTAKVRMEFMWRSFMTEEQIAQSENSFQPTELYNLYWADDRFIYAVSPYSETITTPVVKLNGVGDNVLDESTYFGDLSANEQTIEGRIKNSSSKIEDKNKLKPLFTDITADTEGVFAVLDGSSGKIYQYDEDCNLLCVFGGIGYRKGQFTLPVAIENNSNNDIYVLDAKKNSVTVMEETYYGEQIREALYLHRDGLYEQALDPWFEVLRMNANYYIAYIGIGKAYMAMKDYEQAMHYFKLAGDKDNFSAAKGAVLEEIMRENFALLVTGVAIVMVVILFYDGIKKNTKKLVQSVKQCGRRMT